MAVRGAPKITARWRGDLSETYDQAVRRWMDEPDAGKALRQYRTRVFPLACERMRDLRREVAPLELLFVPVGTQPYAPTLAIVANPARCVALVETDSSAPYADQVEAAFRDVGKGARPVFVKIRIVDNDLVDAGRKMKAVFDSRGLPDGSAVGADITGGRKTMTAAIAGLASVFGWRMTYVEGEFERAKGAFAHHERIVELPNVLTVFGRERREAAVALIRAGACAAATRELDLLIEESAASARDRNLLQLVQTAAALRAGDIEEFAQLAAGAARAMDVALPRKVTAVLARVKKGGAAARPGRLALTLLAADVRLAEGDEVGARVLLERAYRLARQKPPTARADLERALSRLIEKRLQDEDIELIEALDARFGTGLSAAVEMV